MEALVGILLIWVVAPVALGVLLGIFCVKYYSQKKRLEKMVDNLRDLYQQEKLGAYAFDRLMKAAEKSSSTWEPPAAPVGKQEPGTPTPTDTIPQQPEAAGSPLPVVNPASSVVSQPVAEPGRSYYSVQQAAAAASRQATSLPKGKQILPPEPALVPPASSRQKNPAGIILILGVFFIVLAGLIFATSTWAALSNAARTAVVLSQSVLFFAVSALAHKKLKLVQTGMAFYVLGSLFSPVSVLVMAFFDLSPLFSLGRPGVFATGAAAAFLLGVACMLGGLLYRQAAFVWGGWLCITLFIAGLGMRLLDSYDILVFVLSLYSLIIMLTWKKFQALYLRKPQGPAFLFSQAEQYASANMAVCAAMTLLSPGDHLLSAVAVFLYAALSLAGGRLFSKHLPGGLGAYPFAAFLVLGLYRLAPGDDWLLPLFVCGGATVTLLGGLRMLDEKMRQGMLYCALAILAGNMLLSTVFWEGWDSWILLSLAILTASVAVAALQGRNAFRRVLPVFMILLSIGTMEECFYHSSFRSALFGGMMLAAYLLCHLVRCPSGSMLRSKVGEILFPLFAYSGILFSYFDRDSHLIAQLLGGAMVAISCQDRKAARFVLPSVIILFSFSVADLFSLPDEALCMAAYLLLALWGTASQFHRRGLYLGEMLWPLQLSTVAWGLLLPTAIWGTGYMAPYLWILAAFGIIILVAPIAPNDDRRRIPGQAAFWLSGSGVLGAVFFTVRDLFPHLRLSWYMVSLPAACVLLTGLARLSVIRRHRLVQENLLLLGPGGLALSSLLLVFCAMDEQWNNQGYLLIAVLFCATAYAVFHRMRLSLMGTLHAVALYGLLWRIALLFRFWPVEKEEVVVSVFLFGIFALLGRTVYPRLFEKGVMGQLDCLSLASALSPMILLSSGHYFTGLVLVTVLLALLLGRTDLEAGDKLLQTGICLSLCGVVWSQDFLVLPRLIRTEWNLLPLILALFVMQRWIWPGRKVVEHLQYGYVAGCAVILAVDAISTGHPADALILGIGALALLVASFSLHSKRWFLLSTATLASLGIYLSRTFWLSLAWWVYLLAAGILLIMLGAANERARQRGGLKSKVIGFWGKWDW